jgi:hypothetical protein
MCDFSLQSVRSRPAKVGDRLVTRDFGTGTHGFAAADNFGLAVCVMPGTTACEETDPAKSRSFAPEGSRPLRSAPHTRQVSHRDHPIDKLPVGRAVDFDT